MNRKSGVLLHISSLPGGYGIGDLGPSAYDFVNQLEAMKQSYWQILPINDINENFSPYDTTSAFAQNPMLISIELLFQNQLILEHELDFDLDINSEKIDFAKIESLKMPMIERAAARFLDKMKSNGSIEFDNFCKDNEFWLSSFACFKVLKNKFEKLPWYKWGKKYRRYDRKVLSQCNKLFHNEIEIIKIIQFFFAVQWNDLKSFSKKRGIKLIGDLPIYVSHDSADVWSNQNLFKLHENGKMVVKSGCPPDYFMDEGQLWGHPIYNWEEHEKDNFQWWVTRVNVLSSQVDMIRFDHFNGLLKYWEIPAENSNAIDGVWVNGPAHKFINVLYEQVPDLNIIAEDLGELALEVRSLRKIKNIPGMQVFQFFYDQLSKDCRENKILYTGTHDNDTLNGWYDENIKSKIFINNEAEFQSEELKEIFFKGGNQINWSIIKFCMETKYPVVIFPLQDLIGLKSESRMNIPGTLTQKNWSWRYHDDELNDSVIKKMQFLTQNTGRA